MYTALRFNTLRLYTLYGGGRGEQLYQAHCSRVMRASSVPGTPPPCSGVVGLQRRATCFLFTDTDRRFFSHLPISFTGGERQLRASGRTRPTPRSRASAATPRARQRRLHASSAAQ
eukprot:scaffold15834_cov66-Phaeocystis_antarctica.AAC.6